MLTNYIPASYRDIFASYKRSYIEVGTEGNHKIVTNRKSLAVLICGISSFISQGIMIIAIHYMFNKNATGHMSMQNVKSLFNMSLFFLISSLSRFLFVRWLTGLSDYVGRNAVLLLENMLLTISAIVGIGSSSSISLFILSAFWGIFDLYYPVGKALLNDINTLSTQRTKAFSLYCGNVAIGFGLGLIIGVIMTTNFGLDSSCILVMVINLCSILLLVTTTASDTSTEWIIEKNDQSPYLRNWTCLDLVPVQDIDEMWQQGNSSQQSSSQPTHFCRMNISSGTISARLKMFILTYAPWEGGLIANHCTTPLLWLNEALAMAGMKMVLSIYSDIMRIQLPDSFISFTLLLVAMGIGMIFIPSMILQFVKEPGIVFIGVLLSALGCLFLSLSGSDLVGQLDWPEFVGIIIVAVGTCWLPASCSLITAMYPVNRQGEIQGVITQIDIVASLAAVSISVLLDSLLMYDSPVYWHGAPYLLAFLFYLSSAIILLSIYQNKICERQDRLHTELSTPPTSINPVSYFQNKDTFDMAQEPYLRSLALSPLSPTSPRSRSSSVALEEPNSAKSNSKDITPEIPRSNRLMLGNYPPPLLTTTTTSAIRNSFYHQEHNDIDASPDAIAYNNFEVKDA